MSTLFQLVQCIANAPIRLWLTALAHEAELRGALPCAALYERSYMHREVVTHVLVRLARLGLYGVYWVIDSPLLRSQVTPRTDFIITGSSDGVLKFWKKLPGPGLEFVKAYRCVLSQSYPCAGTATLDSEQN